MMNIFKSEQHGCVYTLENNVLLTTPQDADGFYYENLDLWDEVDEMALLGEEQSIQDHVSYVIRTLAITQMKTTTATYKINVTLEGGKGVIFEKTMPTKPTTQKGIKAQNSKLEKWCQNNFPNWTEINITPIN